VHGLPSLITGGVPAPQVPTEHDSEPLHALPSEHEVPSGAIGLEHTPLDELQVPATWQASLAVQITELEFVHTPAWHLSARVQELLSLHAVPSAAFGFEQMPVVGLHVPAAWQASLAVHTRGLPPLQTPARQVSVLVQPLPSLQLVPLAAIGLEQVPLAGLHVPTV